MNNAKRPMYRIFPDWMDVLECFDDKTFKNAMMAIKAKYEGQEPVLEEFDYRDRAVMKMILAQIDRLTTQGTRERG